MIYEECKATLFNDASSRNNTPGEAPLCARDCGIDSNYIHHGSCMGGGGGGGGLDPQNPLAGSALETNRPLFLPWGQNP